jgi:hypothetical protein
MAKPPDFKYRLKTLLITLLLIECAAVFIIWPFDIATGAYVGGLFGPMEDEMIPIFGFTADMLMAIVTGLGLIGWLRRAPWGKGITLLGLGMFCYSAINGLGWALLHNWRLALPDILTLILTALALPFLLKKDE